MVAATASTAAFRPHPALAAAPFIRPGHASQPPFVRRPLSSSRGLKLGGVPMQHCGVSDLMNDTSLFEAIHTGEEALSAEIEVVSPSQQGSARSSLEDLSRAPTLNHDQSPGSASAKCSPLGRHNAGGSAVDGGGGVNGGAAPPLPPPAAANLPGTPPPTMASPLLATRSKGEALVQAALSSFSAGVHSDFGGCPFMEDFSAVLRGVDSASGHTTLALCGVYDGHGGKEAARYLKNYLHSSVAAQLGIEPSASAKASAETAASAAFTSFAASAKFEEGTTASCALSSTLVTHPSHAALQTPGGLRPLANGGGLRQPPRAEYGFDDAAARQALLGGFSACEHALVRTRCASGSTAAVLLLQNGGRCLNVAWCGDCRVVLCRGGELIELTTDHTPASPGERQRVLREGGTVEGERLGGNLSVTRAFGDVEPSDATAGCAADPTFSSMAAATGGAGCGFADAAILASPSPAAAFDAFGTGGGPAACGSCAPSACGLAPGSLRDKLPGLTAVPEMRSEPLQADDEFVILATDGLWDVLSSKRVVSICRAELRAYEDAQMAAERLIDAALRTRHCEDNITAMVVPLFAPRPENGARAASNGWSNRSSSFVHLNTPSSFVRVVGGFE